MNVNRFLMLVLCAVLAPSAFADGDNRQTARSVLGSLDTVVMFSAGPAWASAGQTQTLYIQPSLPETYVAYPKTQLLGDGEFFLGVQRLFLTGVQIQAGIAVAAATTVRLQGDIWQDENPNFNNFLYSYSVNHAHVAAKGKFLTMVHSSIQPYVSGSLGVGFNHSYNYSSVSKAFEVLPEPAFKSYTASSFTYTLGAGLQKKLSTRFSAGLGYEFTDWGASALSPASTEMTMGHLTLSHLYTHQLQFNLSAIL